MSGGVGRSFPVQPIHVFGSEVVAPATTESVVLARFNCPKGTEALTNWIVCARLAGANIDPSYIVGITYRLLVVQGIASQANEDLIKGKDMPWETSGPETQYVSPESGVVFRNVPTAQDERLVLVARWDIATAPAGLSLIGNANGIKWQENELNKGQKLQLLNVGIG